jgi:type VI secretion system secreted protein VgrG
MGLVTKTTIYLKGEKFTSSFNSLSLYQEISDHHHLEIAFRMDMFEELSENPTSLFGEKISLEIAAFDDQSGKEKLQFVGIITQIKKTKTDYGAISDEIIIVAKSPTILADNGPNYRSFVRKNPADIAKIILGDYSQLNLDISEIGSEFVMPYSVQHNESAFDYVCRLGAQHGIWCYYNGAKFVFGNTGPGTPIDLNYLVDLKEFNLSMLPQPTKFSYTTYDFEKKAYESKSTNGKGIKSIVKDGGTGILFNSATGATANLGKVVSQQHDAIVSNEIRFSGTSDNPKIALGCLINPKGADDGTYRVIKISHSCNEIGNYENHFEAVSKVGSNYPYPYTNIRAFPGTQNQIGLVVQTNEDPDNLGRIKVKLPYQHKSSEAIWMRMITPYAGNEHGIFFLPEVDDEVLVGFEGGNAEHPYILGCLYNGKDKQPITDEDGKNNIKAIITRSKLSVKFDDEKKILTIETPGNNTFILDDDEKSINIKDMNDNSIVMDSSGITMNTPKDINLKADGNINLTTTSKLELKASADATMEGMNITHTAKTAFTAKGNASAEISASGSTTVKGGTVMIN